MKPYLLLTATLAILLLGAGCTKTNDNAAIAPVDTQNWKMYTNTACKFSFRYPDDAVVNLVAAKFVEIMTEEDLNFQKNQEGEVPPFFYIAVSCLDDLPSLIANHGDNFDRPVESITNLEDFLNANTLPSIKLIGQTTVDGYPAFKTIVGAYSDTYALWIDRAGVIYQLAFSLSSDNDKLISPIQQQILASFVFTE